MGGDRDNLRAASSRQIRGCCALLFWGRKRSGTGICGEGKTDTVLHMLVWEGRTFLIQKALPLSHYSKMVACIPELGQFFNKLIVF